MQPNPFLGVFLHALGGMAAGSFYICFKPVTKWAWETYWLVAGIAMWLITPWVVAVLTVPDPVGLLQAAPVASLGWSYFFGVLWGVGGLMYGLSMRYLGLSLGNALALGSCAAFGTLVPPLFHGTLDDVASTYGGQIVLVGVAVCLTGIAICGLAGMKKEREMPEEKRRATIKEFNFAKGFWIAIICGIMSACMAFGIDAGKPIAKFAVERNVAPLFQNTPVYIVIFAGGLTTNLIYCIYLHRRNKSAGDYVNRDTPLAINYFFAALAGVVWYCQFMFYGMGTTQMGKYDFSSWTLHMACIIIFSNMWGFASREWQGASSRTRALIFSGISVLILSTVVVGYGNYETSRATPKAAQPTTEQAGH